MKKLLFIICFMPLFSYGGTIYKILYDTVFIGSIPYRTATGELLLFNATKDTTESVLYNTGNGKTEFKKVRLIRLNDSTYVFKIGTTVIGDSIKIRSSGSGGGGGGSTIYAGQGLFKRNDSLLITGRMTEPLSVLSVGSAFNNPIGGTALVWADIATRPTITVGAYNDAVNFLTGVQAINFNTTNTQIAQIGLLNEGSSSDLDDTKLFFVNAAGDKHTYLIGLPTTTYDQIVVRDSATNELAVVSARHYLDSVVQVASIPQSLSRTFTDSISLSISGSNTVKLPYAVDSVGATSDSIIVYKFGIRKSYTNGASSGASLSGLTVATATNAINNANYKQRWSWNTIGADTSFVLGTTSTQANSNLQTVLAVTQSGANATSTQSTFGIKISNVKTGTSATNVGLDIVCSGGATNNAINIQSGRLQMNANGIYFSNNSSISELASAVSVNTTRLGVVTTLSGAGQAFGINNGGYNQFSVGMYSSYTAPYISLGGADWNGGSTFYSYGTNSVLFKNIVGDLALMQNTGITYNTTFTPTETVRFKVDGSVGVGTASPNASALMDLTSTTRGFLPPRMTTTQRDAISTPAAGLIIYNTTTNKLNVFTTTWEVITSL